MRVIVDLLVEKHESRPVEVEIEDVADWASLSTSDVNAETIREYLQASRDEEMAEWNPYVGSRNDWSIAKVVMP